MLNALMSSARNRKLKFFFANFFLKELHQQKLTTVRFSFKLGPIDGQKISKIGFSTSAVVWSISWIIIDPHEILLLCVCVGSSILVAPMCEFSRICTCDNRDAHCSYSLFVMIIFSILMVPRVVIEARCQSCSKQF